MSRPTTKQPGAVWALLDAWAREHPLDPNQRQIAGLLGVSQQLLSQWKFCQSTLQPDDMDRIARETGIPYAQLAAAVREDQPRVRDHISSRRNPEGPRGKPDVPAQPFKTTVTLTTGSGKTEVLVLSHIAARRMKSAGKHRHDEIDGVGEGSQDGGGTAPTA